MSVESSGSTRPLRRFPGLEPEDMAAFQALPDAASRAYENTVRQQLRLDRYHRVNTLPASQLGASIETLAEPELARWGRGAGGGRHRRPHGHGPDA